MKSWKGWANAVGDIIQPDKTKYFTRPVLVIDASDFPVGYPMIDSEWLAEGLTVRVLTLPWLDSVGYWRVYVDPRGGGDSRREALLSSLKPIPETAKGEVVGTVKVKLDRGVYVERTHFDGALEEATYDIVRRDR